MTTRQFQESSALRIFLSYFKPHRKLFILDMCCALMIAMIDLAFPYVSRWCMYQLLPESAYRTFFAVRNCRSPHIKAQTILTYIPIIPMVRECPIIIRPSVLHILRSRISIKNSRTDSLPRFRLLRRHETVLSGSIRTIRNT